MGKTQSPAIDLARPALWHAILSHPLTPPGAAHDFTRRLADANGWSRESTARVVHEYRRFCYLAVTAGHPVTPSDAVDQAWHLHLLHSRDYWLHFCPHVLGRDLHHEPSAGGSEERHRFYEDYAKTLARYAATFGELAPPDLWPPAAQRLLDDPRARRVHPRDALILPRRLIARLLLDLLLLLLVFLL